MGRVKSASTFEEYQKYFKKQLENEAAWLLIGNDILADIQQRVFVEGFDHKKNSMGKYSTTPIYINHNKGEMKDLPKRKPRGKGGFKTRKGKISKKKYNTSIAFKNGNKRKTTYYAGGYKEFRKAVGRNYNYVDLRLTSNMRKAMVINNYKTGFSITFNGNVLQLEKASGTNKKYKWFGLTKEELNRLDFTIGRYLIQKKKRRKG